MNLISYGWTDFLDAQFNNYSSGGLQPARVVRSDRGEFQLIGMDGVFRAQPAGLLDSSGEPAPIATGDWVAVDRSQDTAVVRAILPRKSALTRRRAGVAERAQVVAANVDFVLVVDGLDRGPNQRRIERGVALAYGGGATPIVVLSKADLCNDRERVSMLVEEAAPFADIDGLSEGCRFGDCNHSGEPGCAVVEAVAVGELPASRLASYQKLLREAEIHEIRHDASKARLSKNRERNFAKICRAEQKRKNR